MVSPYVLYNTLLAVAAPVASKGGLEGVCLW